MNLSEGNHALDHQADDPDAGLPGVIDLGLVDGIGGLGHQSDCVPCLIEPLDGGLVIAHKHNGDLAVLHHS